MSIERRVSDFVAAILLAIDHRAAISPGDIPGLP
jgi:hypothetical protein